MTDLELALAAADLADRITLAGFEATDVSVGWKDDRSEVTEIDRQTETAIGDLITAERATHGFFGEEHGLRGNATSPWRWIVDPIDGTSGFVRGIPVWGSLIALTHRDRGVTVGVVSAPALARRWWASAGEGSFADGRRCQVSDIDSIPDAQVNITMNEGWRERGSTAALTDLAYEARRSRSFGDFWQHCLVAEGALDVAIDSIGVAPYDLAAVSLIVTEAGGRFTNAEGQPSWQGPTAISTNGHLHDEVIARLS